MDVYEIKMSIPTLVQSCAQYGPNWVSVPANADLGTSQFCMMKFEARNVNGVPTSTPVRLPWVNITHNDAYNACQDNNMRIMNSSEWQAMARSAENTAWNWSSGIVGVGKINDGHSDNNPSRALGDINITNYCDQTEQTCSNTVWHAQRRVTKLSNGEKLWDVAGNVGMMMRPMSFSNHITDDKFWIYERVIVQAGGFYSLSRGSGLFALVGKFRSAHSSFNDVSGFRCVQY